MQTVTFGYRPLQILRILLNSITNFGLIRQECRTIWLSMYTPGVSHKDLHPRQMPRQRQ
jgi:hypothetical protein